MCVCFNRYDWKLWFSLNRTFGSVTSTDANMSLYRKANSRLFCKKSLILIFSDNNPYFTTLFGLLIPFMPIILAEIELFKLLLLVWIWESYLLSFVVNKFEVLFLFNIFYRFYFCWTNLFSLVFYLSLLINWLFFASSHRWAE